MRGDGLLAVFADPRLAHRVAVALEKAGAMVIDQVAWMYGNGSGINVKFVRGHANAAVEASRHLNDGPAAFVLYALFLRLLQLGRAVQELCMVLCPIRRT